MSENDSSRHPAWCSRRCPCKTQPGDYLPPDPPAVMVWDVQRNRSMLVAPAEARAGMVRYARSLGAGSPACAAAEDFAIDRWLTPGRSLAEAASTYSKVTQANLAQKIIAHETYFSDILTTRPAFTLALMGAILCLALVRAFRAQPGPE